MKSKLYLKSQHYLAMHKKLPIFLSHGGIHLAVLLLLLVTIGILGYYIYEMSVRKYVVWNTKIEFVNPEYNNAKYPLRHFSMTIKTDSVSDKSKVNIDADFHEYTDITRAFDNISDQPVKWTWENHYPTDMIFYKFSGANVTKGYEDSVKVEQLGNGFTTTFKNYYIYSMASKQTSGNLFMEKSLNPYYCAYIRLSQPNVNLDSLSDITIDLSKSKAYNTVVTFDNICPVPSEVGLNKIVYRGKAKVEEVFNNGGIFIEAKDTVKAYRADRLFLLYSVLMGTLIAFCLDIIIKLIYKWRGIKLEREES